MNQDTVEVKFMTWSRNDSIKKWSRNNWRQIKDWPKKSGKKIYDTKPAKYFYVQMCKHIYVHASIRSFLPYSQSIILLVDLINSLSANIENWQFKSSSNINIGQNMQR